MKTFFGALKLEKKRLLSCHSGTLPSTAANSKNGRVLSIPVTLSVLHAS